jgi:hypothetical protein
MPMDTEVLVEIRAQMVIVMNVMGQILLIIVQNHNDVPMDHHDHILHVHYLSV